MQQAIARQEFEVFYQPQVRLNDGAITGAEALLRWRHPERGLLAPAAFITFLEASRQAETVGQWVLETACRQASNWQRHHPTFQIGVNLFEVQLRSHTLFAGVTRALDAAGLAPQFLELEITENVLLEDDDTWVSRIRAIRDLGVGLAFDDYGTGYASLSLLKRFPLTRLKIDRSFVRDLVTDPDDAAIVEAIVALGRQFNFAIIAEGVETGEQEQLLVKYGCEEAQGYLYGKPMCAAHLTACLLADASSSAPFKNSRRLRLRTKAA